MTTMDNPRKPEETTHRTDNRHRSTPTLSRHGSGDPVDAESVCGNNVERDLQPTNGW